MYARVQLHVMCSLAEFTSHYFKMVHLLFGDLSKYLNNINMATYYNHFRWNTAVLLLLLHV